MAEAPAESAARPTCNPHVFGLDKHEVAALLELCKDLTACDVMISEQLALMAGVTTDGALVMRYNQILKTLLCIRDHRLAAAGLYRGPSGTPG